MQQYSWQLTRISTILIAIGVLFGTPTALSSQATPPPDPRFGAIGSYFSPHLATELGVGWDRIVVRWDNRQPEGPDDWVITDDEKDWIETSIAGQREIAMLLIGTPPWATEVSPHNGVPTGLYLPYDDPDNHWGQFVTRIVEENHEQVKHWIVWNEPDIAPDHPGVQLIGTVGDYYQMVKVAHQAARAIDPDAQIHLGAFTYWHDVVYGREPYLERFLNEASQDPSAESNGFYFDVATFHIYFDTETVYDILKQQQETLQEFGLDKPIWMNETNAPPYDDPEAVWETPLHRITMRQQASFLVQAHALALAAGAERIATYKLKDFGPHPAGDSYGIQRADDSLRPIARALGAITTHFAGAETIHHYKDDIKQIVTLERGKLVTRVVWARTAQEVHLVLPVSDGAEATMVYDRLGRGIELDIPTTGHYEFPLPGAECLGPDGHCIVGGDPYLVVERLAD